MVYKTWSYHFSKNWHFYAIIAVLAVGVVYLSQKVYRMNKEIANKKSNRKRKDETRDHYSRDYDVEAGKSDFTEEKVNEDEMFDDGEPIEIVVEKLKTDEPGKSESPVDEEKSESAEGDYRKKSESAVDDDFEKIPSEENSVEPVEEKKDAPVQKTEIQTCVAQIKSGKRKGELCGKPAMTGINTCRFHT